MPAGRPKGIFKLFADEATLDTVKALAKIQCTQVEAECVLKVCEKTFVDFLKSIKKGTRSVGKRLGRGQGRASSPAVARACLSQRSGIQRISGNNSKCGTSERC
jgi:hypothetical protein